VIASLGAGLASGHQLAAVTAAFVLLTAVVGPIAARRAGAVPLATRSP